MNLIADVLHCQSVTDRSELAKTGEDWRIFHGFEGSKKSGKTRDGDSLDDMYRLQRSSAPVAGVASLGVIFSPL